jgi:hypothetical protein
MTGGDIVHLLSSSDNLGNAFPVSRNRRMPNIKNALRGEFNLSRSNVSAIGLRE